MNTEEIINLYKKYKNELIGVGDDIREFLIKHKNETFNPQLADIEAELTYMFIRELKPENVVEFSPCHGYSSLWILNALEKNDKGTLFSFDLIKDSEKYIPIDLKTRRIFVRGNVKENVHKFPYEIDYLFIDSDHSRGFAEWYIKNVFPLVRKNIYVSVHDVMKRKKNGSLVYGEAKKIIEWLDQNDIRYYSACMKKDIKDVKVSDPLARKIIDEFKKENEFKEINVFAKCQRNSAIFFQMGETC
jgi:predicted O-methyltransferase YrrM